MNALELAKKRKQESEEENRRKALDGERRSDDLNRARSYLEGVIAGVLQSLKPAFVIEKKRFGGSDYWVVCKGSRDILSCVLSYVSGTTSYSDDYRDVPYEQWEVEVVRGLWSGPAGHQRGHAGITDKERLTEVVAEIMKDHI